MRHLLALLLAVALAAAVFFAATWGFMHLTGPHRAALTTPAGMEALAAMAGTGLLLGLLLCIPWVSPLAAGLPGLVLLAWTGALMSGFHAALRYIPMQGQVFGAGFQALLMNGVLELAGMAMIMPMFIPSRWHRRRPQARLYEDEDTLTAPTGLITN